MELQIKGHEVQINDQLRELITKKLSRLDRYLPQSAMIDAKLNLHERHTRSAGPRKLVEMTIVARGALLRAEAQAGDFGAALDELTDRMTRQIVRYRTRFRDLKRRPVDELPLPELPAEAASLVQQLSTEQSEGAQTHPIRVKRFAAKPMDVGEAIEQMELLSHDFFVFLDKDAQQPSVIYRRREGGYGLIQPEFS